VVSRTSKQCSISANASDTVLAGASGCVVASRLASSPEKPCVLLLEAGGSNQSATDLSGSERFNLAFSPGSPYNWSYQTTPQYQLNGQAIDYSRGRGLGGSTAINFCGWTVGASDDFDEYAKLVGDDHFNWENVKRCLRRIERLHPTIPEEGLRKYVNARAEGMRRPMIKVDRGNSLT
jgi:choline dehydrogenase-like flavoprotein